MLQNTVRDRIVNYIDNMRHWLRHRSLEREGDPQKRLEKRIWMEMTGAFLGGMASSGAWASYKSRYYGNLTSEDDKKNARCMILSMLKSKKYSISDKAIISYVCADLEIKEALPEVNDLLQRAKDSVYIKLYRLSQEALTTGMSVNELVDKKFKKGERM